MSDDVKDWLGQCVVCIKRKSPVGRHHPLGNIPTGHRWDRIAMDILDVCDPTPTPQLMFLHGEMKLIYIKILLFKRIWTDRLI